MAAVVEVKYFNTFILKKTNYLEEPIWNGSYGVPEDLSGYPVVLQAGTGNNNWAIEESRIRGGYNNTTVDFGVKAYIVDDKNKASYRTSSLIWSGIFNSRTGINQTNVFSVGEDITKTADPSNASIQRLYAENTNLTIFQESKVSRALMDKDAIYNAEGGGTVTSSNLVIGVIQPYAGEFGISKNPESFAVYGYNKYFSDKTNNAILRLSASGIDEISAYGMRDYFKDELSRIDNNSGEGLVIGGYDLYNNQYVVSTQQNPIFSASDQNYNTVSFDEGPLGWVSFFTFKPDQMFSLKNKFYSTKDGGIWEHYVVVSSLSTTTTTTASAISSVISVANVYQITAGMIVTGVPGIPTGTIVLVVGVGGNPLDLELSNVVSVFNGDNLTFSAPDQLSGNNRGNFYGISYQSKVTVSFNAMPANSKSFNTVSYEGANGWMLESLISDPTGSDTQPVINWRSSFDESSGIYSYYEGEFVQAESTAIVAESVIGTSVLIKANVVPVLGSSVTGVGITSESIVLSYDNIIGQANGDSSGVNVNLLNVNSYIPPGTSISGNGIVPGTTVVSFNQVTGDLVANNVLQINANDSIYFNGIGLMTLDLSCDFTENTILSFTSVTNRVDYQTVFGTQDPQYPVYHAGFDRKENKYVANLINNSSANDSEVIWGNSMSGVKGFYTLATFSTDTTTDPGGDKQLFSVESSYTLNNGY